MRIQIERALEIRDSACDLLKRNGAWQESTSILVGNAGDLKIAVTFVTPQNFAIDIWSRNEKVFVLEWDSDHHVNVICFRPGG